MHRSVLTRAGSVTWRPPSCPSPLKRTMAVFMTVTSRNNSASLSSAPGKHGTDAGAGSNASPPFPPGEVSAATGPALHGKAYAAIDASVKERLVAEVLALAFPPRGIGP